MGLPSAELLRGQCLSLCPPAWEHIQIVPPCSLGLTSLQKVCLLKASALQGAWGEKCLWNSPSGAWILITSLSLPSLLRNVQMLLTVHSHNNSAASSGAASSTGESTEAFFFLPEKMEKEEITLGNVFGCRGGLGREEQPWGCCSVRASRFRARTLR